jgi:hypothetical protein
LPLPLPLLLLLLLMFRHAVRVSLELLQLLQENGLFFECFPYVCPSLSWEPELFFEN